MEWGQVWRIEREVGADAGWLAGSNLLRNLFEYMIFDTDFSGEIDVEEVQQMFFVYYGFKGNLLDQTVHWCWRSG